MRHPLFIGLICFCLLLIWSETSLAITLQPGGAIRGTEKVSDQDRQLIRKLGPEARSALDAGDYDLAFSKAKKITELAPEVYQYQFFLGNAGFAAGKMEESVKAYDAVIRLDPTSEPQLWQRGLALYYAKRFADGVKQFETHQTVNSQDVENAVWHLLCAARISDVEKARKKLIPITGDSRVPMSQVYEMFAGRMTPEKVLEAAQKTSTFVKQDDSRHRLQQYYAHLYIGLYHEMLNQHELAVASLNQAKQVNPLPKSNFMGQVADVHLRLRAAEAKQKKNDANKPNAKQPGAKKNATSQPDKNKSGY